MKKDIADQVNEHLSAIAELTKDSLTIQLGFGNNGNSGNVGGVPLKGAVMAKDNWWKLPLKSVIGLVIIVIGFIFGTATGTVWLQAGIQRATEDAAEAKAGVATNAKVNIKQGEEIVVLEALLPKVEQKLDDFMLRQERYQRETRKEIKEDIREFTKEIRAEIRNGNQ